MGLFDTIGHGLKGLLGEGFSDRASIASAIANGDYQSAAALRDASRKRKDAVVAQQAQAQQKQAIAAALKAKGFSDDDITLALINPQEFGKRYNERFGTQNVSPGSAVVVGGPQGAQEQYRAPVTPTELQRNYQFLQGENPSAAQSYLTRETAPGVDWQTAQNADGTKTLFPIPRGAPTLPQQPKAGDIVKAPWATGGAGSGPRTFRR